MTESSDEIDGRRLRREQNRELVLDALGELFAEGNLTPTTRQIADRAGLSMRSLVRYFDDFDDLLRSAIGRGECLALPHLDVEIDPNLATTERITALIEARLAAVEAIAPFARAGRVAAHRQPIIRERMARSRAFLRDQMVRVLSPELEQADGSMLAVMDVLLSFESFELLAGVNELSSPDIVRALAQAVEGLLLQIPVAR